MQAAGSIKDMETEINRVRNRLKKLQKRNQAQRQSYEHNSALKNQILLKKIAMAQSLRSEEDSIDQQKREQDEKLRMLKIRNRRLRHSQKQQLSNVMKAVYFVKADDAREARKISQQHKQKIRELNNSSLQQKRSKRQRIRSENGKAEQYWKEKLNRVYLQNHLQKIQKERAVSSKKRQLDQLIKKQNNLKEQLNKNYLHSSKSKQQRIGVMAMPVRQVASVLQIHDKNNSIQDVSRAKSGSKDRKAKDFEVQIINFPEQEHVTPKTEVSEVKLKIVLEKLRKKQI